MQMGGSSSRFAINQIGEKSLQQNNYSARGFSKTKSGFGIFLKKKKKEQEELDMTSISDIFSED